MDEYAHKKLPSPYDPTLALCSGPYVGPMGGGVFSCARNLCKGEYAGTNPSTFGVV